MDRNLITGILFGMVIGIIIGGMGYLGISYFLVGKPTVVDQTASATPTTTPTFTATGTTVPSQGILKTTGILYTAGTAIDDNSEASKFEYQITNLVQNDGGKRTTAESFALAGYYLNNAGESYDKYLGKCVTITGAAVADWNDSEHLNQYFNLGLLENPSIEIKPFELCKNGFLDTNPGGAIANTQKQFKGIIKLGSQRPAADIAYDYSIQLTTPYQDNINASGKTLTVKSVMLLPTSFTVLNSLQANRNNNVTVTGYFAWGFAESKVFFVESVIKN